MTRVEEIEAAIEALSGKDYVRLRRWFSEKDWREWDRQIEADSDLGKLDFLVREALDRFGGAGRLPRSVEETCQSTLTTSSCA